MDFLKIIPKDIILYKIIPYTYSIQNDILLKDIQNFHESKKKISIIYFNKYNYLLEYEKYADKNWLVSDLVLYFKKSKNPQYIKINRLYNSYFKTNKSIHSQFNIFWSFLNSTERDYFIKIREKK